MQPNDLVEEIRNALHGAPFELTDAGMACHRNRIPKGALVDAEAVLLRSGPVRVLDFTHGGRYLAENAVPRDGADPGGYDGVVGPCGHKVFRVDHHYDLPSLSSVSTTPLVLGWLRGLWRRGRRDVLAEVARSRYIADHADTDILLSNYLASRAEDESTIYGPLGAWLTAAALRNDYVVIPGAADEPQAGQIFYACLGMEEEILAGELRFADVQRQILPQLDAWVRDDSSLVKGETGKRLDDWVEASRAKEERTLSRIAGWESAGKLRRELGGRLAVLEADEKIDNADFYLYLAKRNPPVVQVLVYPEAGAGPSRVTVKLRAHDGFDLYPLYARLTELVPEGAFGGRTAAGGSKPIPGIDRDGLVEAVRRCLPSAGG